MHNVVFGGFSAEALRERLLDTESRILLTANYGIRGGKRIPLYETSLEAVEGTLVQTVLVYDHSERLFVKSKDTFPKAPVHDVKYNIPAKLVHIHFAKWNEVVREQSPIHKKVLFAFILFSSTSFRFLKVLQSGRCLRYIPVAPLENLKDSYIQLVDIYCMQ